MWKRVFKTNRVSTCGEKIRAKARARARAKAKARAKHLVVLYYTELLYWYSVHIAPAADKDIQRFLRVRRNQCMLTLG